MKKLILGMMLVMGSLSFSNNEGTKVKISNMFDNFKKEQTQDQGIIQEQLNTENKTNINNIFNS